MKYTTAVLALASSAAAQSLQAVLANNTQLSQLANLAQPYLGQLGMAQNITLLAPSNQAVSAFLNSSTAGAIGNQPTLVQAILNYHVLNGTYPSINSTMFVATALQPPQYANVTGGQRVEAVGTGNTTRFFSGLLQNSTKVNNTITFDNGVIHVIDRFLTIPQNCSTTAIALNLTSAVGALTAANLATAVDSTPDLTVFVPNNAAFQAIGANLANLTTQQIASVLQYHVVAGSPPLYSTNIMNGSSLQTLNGANVTMRLQGGSVYVNNARVIQPNVLVANGVIHVIDRVLNPGNSTILPNASTTQQAFPGASSASNVPYTSGVPTPTSAIATSAAATGGAGGSSSSSSGAAWAPAKTGAMGMGALFGGAALIANL